MISRLCWTCRHRRVACDGAEAGCSQCTVIGLDCTGYGATSDAAEQERGGVLVRPLRHVAAVPANPGDGAAAATTSSIVYDPAPPLYSEAQMVLDGIHYFNERVSSDLISVASHFNPYQVSVARINKIPRIYINLLVTAATLHRWMQNDSSITRSAVLAQREHDLFNFRIRALQEVNQKLSATDTQTTDSTLMCVLCLLLSTMQQSAYTDWRVHLEGARRIIQLRGGIKEIIRENPYFKPLLAFFIVIDVMAATTAASTHKYMYPATTMALHYWEIEPGIFQSNLAISAPCPEELFQTLILTNYLRTISKKANLTSRRHSGTLMVLEKVHAFSAHQWAMRMKGFRGWKPMGDGVEFEDTNTVKVTSQPPSPLSPVKSESESSKSSSSSSSVSSTDTPRSASPGDVPNTELWLNIGTIYRAAVLLYAIRTLIIDLPENKDYLAESNAYLNLEAIRSENRKVLADSLTPIFSDPTSAHHLGKLVYFPMFVCGMETNVHEKELQEFVTGGLETVGRACGTLGPISAADELRGYWAASAEAPEGWHITWDDYFIGRPDFIFGF